MGDMKDVSYSALVAIIREEVSKPSEALEKYLSVVSEIAIEGPLPNEEAFNILLMLPKLSKFNSPRMKAVKKELNRRAVAH